MSEANFKVTHVYSNYIILKHIYMNTNTLNSS